MFLHFPTSLEFSLRKIPTNALKNFTMRSQTPSSKRRVLIFESHPVQYKAPVYRLLAQLNPQQTCVVYATDNNLKQGNIDREFGTEVVWDTPLMQGYDWKVLNNVRGEPFTKRTSLTGAGIFRLLTKERPSAVVITHFRYNFDLATYFWALILNIPILIRQETQDQMGAEQRPGWKNVVRHAAYSLLYLPIHHAFSFGKLNHAHLRRHGVPEHKISFARFSVENPFKALSENQKIDARTALRDALSIADDKILLGFFGKLIPKKNPQIILHAIALMPESMRSRLSVVFVGSGILLPELESLSKAITSRFGVHVHFAGFINQTQLPSYYLATDIAILPSLYEETWGLVVNEALQAGCAVIVSDAVGCHPEFSQLERVQVFRRGNAQDLADAIRNCSELTRSFAWAADFMEAYSSLAAAKEMSRVLSTFH